LVAALVIPGTPEDEQDESFVFGELAEKEARFGTGAGLEDEDIIVDDELEAEGREVSTIEGMANGDRLHPLQQKFIEKAALQCGICTPGILMAAKSLLEHNPDPSEEEVRYWLAGNLCRCTGYDKIIRAVMETAADLRRAS